MMRLDDLDVAEAQRQLDEDGGQGQVTLFFLKTIYKYFPSSSSGHLLGLFIQTYRRDAAIFTTSGCIIGKKLLFANIYTSKKLVLL